MLSIGSLDIVCSALPYDNPSVNRMREDAFESLLSSYNPAPVKKELNVLVVEPKDNDVMKLHEFYGSYGAHADIITAKMTDSSQTNFDAVFVHNFQTLSRSADAANFYTGLADKMSHGAVLFATFYRQEELDLVRHILERSGEFDIIAANETSDSVEACFVVDKSYAAELRESLEDMRDEYEAAGVDVDAIIAEYEESIGEEKEFSYNEYAILARRKSSDKCGSDEGHDDGRHDSSCEEHNAEP